jgi:DNA-binding ferritin-like protein
MTYSGSFESTPQPVDMQEMPALEEREAAPRASVEDLIHELVSLGSYVNQLYLQSHLIHLNVEGPLFLPIHKFLNKQYEAHIDQFDQIGEFVRSMDYLMPMCACGLADAYKNFNNVKSYETREMLTVYLKNLELGGLAAKDVGCLAKEVGAPDVENYMADLVKAMFKASWFLKATLRG